MTAPVPARPRRLAFLGNPAIAVPSLRGLVTAAPGLEMELALVVTGSERRRGRRAKPSPTPVGETACELGLTVVHDLAALAERDPEEGLIDLGVVVAYGQIIPAEVLSRVPMVNLHFSLLPRWRGSAPVERALLAGDSETGVCLIDVAESLDAGGVHARVSTAISSNDSAQDLRGRLSLLGADLLVGWLTSLVQQGPGCAEPQEGEPTWAHKLDRKELHLDSHRPAVDLHRMVRVGGAYTTFRDDSLKVWTAELAQVNPGHPIGAVVGDVLVTGDGGLRLVEVQSAGRARMPFSSWAAGARLAPGELLGA